MFQARILGDKRILPNDVRLPDRTGEEMNGEVITYTLSPEELEKYKTKPDEIAFKQRNLGTWKKNEPVEVLSELKKTWHVDEIKRFCKMWKDDLSISEIAKEMKSEDIDEITLLIIDCKRKGLIDRRRNGINGGGSKYMG